MYGPGRLLFFLCLAVTITWSPATPLHAQTLQEGRDYFLKLEASMPADRATQWRAAPGYVQARQNFLTADYTPDISKSKMKRLTKEAKRAARKDTKCRKMELTDAAFQGPLGLDRQVERQILQGQVRNAWSYRISLEGCETAYHANFVLIEENDDELNHVTTLPGTTLAWPSLQSDALPKIALTALQTVRRENPQCIPAGRDRIIATRLDEKRIRDSKMFGVFLGGRWIETWTMQICGQKLDLRVAFRADGSGGASFQAQPSGDAGSQAASK